MRLRKFARWMLILGPNMMIGAFLGAGLYGAFFGSSALATSTFVVIFLLGIVLTISGSWVSVLSRASRKSTHQCSVCGGEFTGRMLRLWKNEHYRTKHPEYAKWFKQSVKKLYLITVPYVAIMVASLFLWMEYGDPYSYLAGFVVLFWIVFVFSYFWLLRRKSSHFRRTWKDQHTTSLGPPATT